MGNHPIAVALCAVGLLPLAACSSRHEGTPSTPTSSTTDQAETAAPAQTPADGIEVSPGGVTTGVQATPDATESGYGQACLAAKSWFDTRGTEPKPLVEEYLKSVQDPGYTGPGTFGKTWSVLTAGEQSAVIMAANGAADGQCG
ncbi:MAG: lipoprotein LpqV [Mycolicibacterium insubricum]|jgi:hypothetical protein|nr:hypothetical protein [Mycobacterium sp.]